jgi:hypothetical protein
MKKYYHVGHCTTTNHLIYDDLNSSQSVEKTSQKNTYDSTSSSKTAQASTHLEGITGVHRLSTKFLTFG